MTKLINLLGQPSAGKSTTMADLYTTLKYQEKQVEMVPEWIKRWAYEQKSISKFDQFYIMGKEIYQQSRLFNKVDYIISDSPVFLAGYYHFNRTGDDYLYEVAKKFYKMAEEDGVKVYNFFLQRNKAYNPVGRYQTEEESDKIADDLINYLHKHSIRFEWLGCSDKERVSSILTITG